jgi:hypothetical protein
VRRIDTDSGRPEPGGATDGGAWSTAHVHDGVTRSQIAQAYGETSVALSPDGHAGRGDESTQSGEGRVVGMVVRNPGLVGAHIHEVDS